MAVKLTLVGLTLLFAVSGYKIAVDNGNWTSTVGAMIPAAILLYMTVRVFRDLPAK